MDSKVISEVDSVVGGHEARIVKGKITPAVIAFTATLLITGTINIIAFKTQGYVYNFKHGFVQSLLMFTGQFLNLITFNCQLMFSSKYRKEHFEDVAFEAKDCGRSPHVSKLILGFPSFFDAIATTLQNFALLLMPASVTQLLSGGTIITSCIISKIMLGRQIHRHHIVGNISALIGFTLVGFSSLVNEDATARYSVAGEILGIILVLLSLVVQGTQINVEELIMMKYVVPPQRMVGMEGFLGIIWTMCWLAIFSYFSCPDNGLCDIGGYLEDPVIGVKMILDNKGLLAWSILIIFSIMFFNLSSLNLTKRMSCIYTAFWSATRTVVVWIVSITLGLETWNWKSSPIEVAGFIFLLVGNLTYNEIIEWKFFGLNKKLEKYKVVKPSDETASNAN